MKEQKLRFALFGNEYQSHKSAGLRALLDCLESHNSEVLVDSTYAAFLHKLLPELKGKHSEFDGDDFDADFVISIGGDGTLLKAASRVGTKQTPIIGVNMGRLGFLADVIPTEVEKVIDSIYKGHYTTEPHTAIQIDTDDEQLTVCPFALNDIAVLKRDNASMISIKTTVDDDYLVTYQADGLIVSTPTGSTAYSLSNGGPIIVPQCGNLCLTPVAPHSLNIRPIVISDSSTVTLQVASRSHNFLVAVDGRSQKLRDTTTVRISKAPYVVRIVKRAGQHYFATLRDKMMWGMDQRS